mgnify:CR=1 FL=1
MFFTSDNASGAAPEIIAAIARANDGFARSYGADPLMAHVTQKLRDTFEAPEAAVYLVATGTVANALALAIHCQPWAAVFAHTDAHIAQDECGAPEFYTNGAKLVGVPGAHGKMTADALAQSLARIGDSGVHGVQRGMVSITNVTEAGTVYTPAEIAALTAEVKKAIAPVPQNNNIVILTPDQLQQVIAESIKAAQTGQAKMVQFPTVKPSSGNNISLLPFLLVSK